MSTFRVFVLLSMCLLVSCKNESISKKYPLFSKPVLFGDSEGHKYTLNLTDSIFVLRPNYIPQSSFVNKIYNDSLFYFVYKSNKLAKLNINQKKIYKIEIPNEIDGSICAIEIINKDSILIAQKIQLKLFLIDRINNLITTKSLKKIIFHTTNSFFNRRTNTKGFTDVNYNFGVNNMYYNKKSKRIHIGIEPFDSQLLKGFENTPRIGVFNFERNKWEKFYAEPKGLYNLRGDYTFGSNFLSFKNLIFKGDSTFVNYKVNHSVSFYIQGKYHKNINFTSLHSKDIKMPLHPNDYSEVEKNKELYLSTPYYYNMYYHKKVKLYSRIYADGQSAFNEEGNYNTLSDRTIYLVFLNENFEYAGEYKFPKNIFSSLIATSDGFLMFTNKHTNHDTQKEYLNLRYVYKIKQISND